MPDRRHTLLVVDDEPHIRASLARLLQQDFEVLTTASGEEAQKLFQTREIHLVLVDQNMPGLSGIQLLEWVRANHPKTFRLLMTGFAELEDVVEAINRGHVYRFLFKPWRADELLHVLRDAANAFSFAESHGRLLTELQQAKEELEKRVQERTLQLEEANRLLQQKNSMLERLALTDELTGLPNRRAIEQTLVVENRRRSRYPTPLAVGLIDADHFKEINTRYLYPGGDQVLIQLGRALNNSLRGVDTVGRWGGEEFLVVAPATNLEGVLTLSERIRQAVERMEVSYQGEIIRVTVSVGFTVAVEAPSSETAPLIHQAAAAVAEAKKRGRNCCVVWPVSPEDSEVMASV